MREGGGRVRLGLGWAGLGGMLIRRLCNGHRIGGWDGDLACLPMEVGRILQIGLRGVGGQLGGGMLRFCGGWLVRRGRFLIWTGVLEERTAEQHRLLVLGCKQGWWW
jgi:hypothetical protein